MRRLILLTAALILGIGASRAVPPTATVIVELEADAGAVYKAKLERAGSTVTTAQLESYRAQLTAQQNALLGRIAQAGIPYQIATANIRTPQGTTAATIEHRYTLVYNGIALIVPVTQEASLRSIAGVKAIHRSKEMKVDLDHSVPFTRAPELYGGYAELTPFDTLNEGYEGQGMIIAVIDTGIEWQHEMFGGDPTPPRLGVSPSVAAIPTNRKVIYHLPMSDLAVEDGFGHGTHVASTAAGYLGITAGADGIPLNADDVPLHGVAPQARLMSYGVCSNILSTPSSLLGVGVGGCLSINTMTALEDAMSPKTKTGFPKPIPHVINMSLGGDFGTPDDETAVAASNAALLGAVVVCSAGNSGDVPSIIGSPSTGRHVISVAAGTDPGSGSNWFVDLLDGGSFPSSETGVKTPARGYPQAPGMRSGISTIPVSGTPAPPAGSIAQYYVYVANGLNAATYPASVSGRIALLDVGGATGVYAETINNAALAGAVAALLIDDGTGATGVAGTIPCALISSNEAAYLKSLMGGSPEDGAISPMPLRINPSPAHFLSEVAGFSSRGPVPDLNQVKPDLMAPGVQVVAAVPPASVIGAVFAAPDGPNYAPLDGTSMAAPHAAGVAALVKQANPSWTPAMVRTAMINTATAMRSDTQQAAAYGADSPSIHGQGGGYVDAKAAATAKAIMGVRGDGVVQPAILGSKSFGIEPVVGNQCVNQRNVSVTITDVRGSGGTYDLAAMPIRGGGTSGVTFTVNPARVSVPANGSATFEAGVRIDGSVLTGDQPVELQWFVVATRSDGSEHLSMPMYYRAAPSQPTGDPSGSTATELYSGSLGLGAQDAGEGESVDIPVQVPAGTFRLQGLLEGDMATNVAYPDLDLQLYDPTGTMIDDSAAPGSVESVDVEVAIPGTYVFRVVNYLNHGAGYDLTVTKTSRNGVAPATLDPLATAPKTVYLTWHGLGTETSFEVQQSKNGGTWQTVKRVGGATTTATFSKLSPGNYSYRVVSHFPGQICEFVAAPSQTQSAFVSNTPVLHGGAVNEQ